MGNFTGAIFRNPRIFRCISIGVSAGGMHALSTIIPGLPIDFPIPIVVIQHISPLSDNYTTRYLDSISRIRVKEVDEKEKLRRGTVYTAPPNYHVLIEEDETFSLSVEERINFARPSIDVFFESAAEVFGPSLIGVILTGANSDGSRGLKRIKDLGGLTAVQDPSNAEVEGMPRAALETVTPDYILKLDEFAPFFIKMGKHGRKKTELTNETITND